MAAIGAPLPAVGLELPVIIPEKAHGAETSVPRVGTTVAVDGRSALRRAVLRRSVTGDDAVS
jgi:hypothetical protein